MTASIETDGVGEDRRGGRTLGSAHGGGLRLPDFFIVGHPKSGTTALYEMLRRHPQIYMPEVKEPWYLASDMRPRFQPARSPHAKTLEDYVRLFEGAGPGELVGEASSSYLLSHTAAQEIARLRPGSRMIAILREPASFLRSLHLQLLRTHVESKQDLRKALALEDARSRGRRIPRHSHRPQLLLYSEHVRYVEQLRRYHAAFPPEQLLVLIYDDFRADNEATVRRVLRFLELDEHEPVQVTDANPTVIRMRSPQLDELLNAVSVGRGPVSRAAKATIKTLTPSRFRSAAIKGTQRHLINGKPQPPDEKLMLELRRRFKGEVAALGEYLDRDLVTLWGYDRLD
jgi:Sulfotransferase domain